jgi:hypothetical protein
VNEQMEDWKIKFEAELAEKRIRIELLKRQDFLDEDGYPTDAALEIIELWHCDDISGWFEFVKSIWHLSSWGWREREVPHSWKKDQQVKEYCISTAGWSGNESIIAAMQKNHMMWRLTWVQSRRGGHYIFEKPTIEE